MLECSTHRPNFNARWLGLLDFREALALQEELLARRSREEIPDTLLLLEHPACYTLGKPDDSGDMLHGLPLYRADRGGGLTFHGPGQLVGYPIFRLPKGGVSRLVDWMEESLLGLLSEVGIEGKQHCQWRGVWVGRRKIASIGLKVKRGISMHGFALNLAPDLRPFERILPCGLPIEMTSVEREGGPVLTTERFAEMFRQVALPCWRGEE